MCSSAHQHFCLEPYHFPFLQHNRIFFPVNLQTDRIVLHLTEVNVIHRHGIEEFPPYQLDTYTRCIDAFFDLKKRGGRITTLHFEEKMCDWSYQIDIINVQLLKGQSVIWQAYNRPNSKKFRFCMVVLTSPASASIESDLIRLKSDILVNSC